MYVVNNTESPNEGARGRQIVWTSCSRLRNDDWGDPIFEPRPYCFGCNVGPAL